MVVANLVGGAAVDGIVATFRDVTEQRNLGANSATASSTTS